MKKFWLCFLFALVLGTSVAWAINYQRFGHRVARFGPFTADGEVTPDNVLTRIKQDLPETDGRARVELADGNLHDFGMMAPGTEGEHVFVVKSVGESDLRLRLGASTCKCTLGELDREALAPGEETEVKLTWTVKEGESTFSQSAQLITNDPAHVVIQLEIVGKVINQVDVVPETWSLGEVATGEPMETSGTIYNFMKHDIKPTNLRFSSEEMTKFAEFEVEPFQPTKEADGIRAAARQAFRVNVKIKPGMRQGAISQNLIFGFETLDENEKLADNGNADNGNEEDTGNYIIAPVKGSIVGQLGMIPNSKLRGQPGGGYVFDFGRITRDSPLKANTFVVLKGSERDNTNLRIGEIYPDEVVKATLGEPRGRGSMKLYPLEIELIPGEKLIERLGKDKDDYGTVWIESDNPKVTKMRIALKFAIEAR